MSKYYSKKAVVNGIEFDSRKEANRYFELSILERAGVISELQRQVKFELLPSQKIDGKVYERPVTYVADFVYKHDGRTVVEDTKGYRKGTAYDVFVIKRKLMLYIHGIRVKEV